MGERVGVAVGVVATGLLIWLVSTPATFHVFMSPSIDSFAIVINGLFFAVLLRLAYERDASPSVAILAGCVGALAYLNKLSYIYIPLALAAVGLLNLAFRRVGWIRASQLSVLCVFAFLLVVVVTGRFIIGREGFHDLLEYHKGIILGSGLYGTGDQDVVSKDEVWRAFAAIPVERTYAVLIALVGGAGLVVAGIVTGLRNSQHVPAAVVSIATGLASVFSAGIVMKHYALHYTAGVSATLPASVVGCYLLAKAWGFYKLRIVGTTLAAIAILLMAKQTIPPLISTLASRTITTQLAKADLQEIYAHLAGTKGAVEFAYKAPFSWYGEGFVIVHAGVPRLTADYLQSRDMISSLTVGLANREIGAYVIDKGYFPTVESVKASPNVALLAPKPVTFKDGDKLIELRTVFLLIPG